MSVPLLADGQFSGMFASVVSIDRLVQRIQDASVRDRTVYIVDVHGHIVAYPSTKEFVPGQDVTSTSPVVKQVKELPQELRATETMHFTLPGRQGRRPVEMIGTYSTIPELRWAVIAQRGLDNARLDAGREGTDGAGAELRGGGDVRGAAPWVSVSQWASRGRFADWWSRRAP